MQNAVLITGAAGGIGKSLCEAFSNAGYFVIASDIVSEFTGCDVYYPMDLLSFVEEEDCRSSFLQFVNTQLDGRRLSALVNNAATQLLGGVSDLSLDKFKNTLSVNVTAPFLLMQILAEKLEEANGSVINIGSIHAVATKPKFVAYATSKSALQGLTQAAAVDLGGRVRVNNIQPAATATEMLVDGFEDTGMLEVLKKYHPVGRIAEPAEIAEVAVFLASDKASFITGISLNIDGGIGIRLHDPE